MQIHILRNKSFDCYNFLIIKTLYCLDYYSKSYNLEYMLNSIFVTNRCESQKSKFIDLISNYEAVKILD
jgi:hypothetical protein